MPDDSSIINLFVSYSHDDDPYFDVFSKGLKKIVINTEHFKWSIWDDTKIHIGTFWDDEIQNNIKDCNVAMLLVSTAFMASTYIMEKEFKEFTQRYSEKGILIIPVVFQPCDFNRWEDLAKLQFFKPKGSLYGKADIENFTFADLIKFKETDGTLIPNPNIDRYILDLVKKVEESFCNFQLMKVKSADSISAEPVITNLNKLSDFPIPSPLFTGRKNEKIEFQNKFELFRIFAIEGLGGTGKTQFAAKCIEEMISDKSKIIWLDGSSQSNFDVFVESAGYGDVLKGARKTDPEIYSGLKDLLEKDERIVFWDNFNDYEDLAFHRFLSFANQYLRKSTIILITKTDPSIERITSLPIVWLEGLDDDALEYAKKLKISNSRYSSISDSDLEIICKAVEGHPLAIEFSMLLMGYGKSAVDIVLHMPEMAGERRIEEFSKRLFFDIFNHPKTSEDERDCFLRCSVFKESLVLEAINFLHDGKDVFSLLSGLMDKLLITFKNGYYEIHPLVRSFSYERLNDKKAIHKKAADYFISQRPKTLKASLEEKIFYHLSEAQEWETIADSIEIIGGNFIHQGQLGLINDLITKLENLVITRPIFDILKGDIAQIKCEWDNAILYFEKASNHTTNFRVKTEGIYKYGEILFRRGDVKESLPYFEKAYLLAQEHNLRKEEARALNDIGLVYFDFDKIDIAYEKHIAALKIRKAIDDVEGVAISYINLGCVFKVKEQYEKALINSYEAKKIAEQIDDKIGLSNYILNIGDILRRQNKLDESIRYINMALKICEEIGDKNGYSSGLSNLGLIYIEQGKLEEGLIKYKESLKLNEEIGDKRGIAVCFNHIGSFYVNEEKYEIALSYLFKSLSIFIEIGIIAEQENDLSWFRLSAERIGKEKFKDLAVQVYNSLNPETQKNIRLTTILNEPVKREDPKVGRNEPCPCGSGKKYKNCHWQN